MDFNFLVDKARYFQEHNIKAVVKQDDILDPKEVSAKDFGFVNTDKLVNKMTDIFPKSPDYDSGYLS